MDHVLQNEPCALCLRALPLIDSHFLPAGLYRRLRTPNEKNQNPILTSRDRAVQIGFQMAEPLLCRGCDGLIGKRGEAYVLPRIRQDSTFPFLDQLRVALEVYRSREWNIYSGDAVGFDMEKIAYFGLSLLWRAAVHTWTMVDGKTTSVALEDNYKEDLRRYLLGETELPKNCFVVVTIATDWASQNACFVPNRIKDAPITAFGLMTKGLYFRIFFGEDVPKELQQICCVSGERKLLFTRDCEDGLIETWRKLMENSRPVGSLAKSLPQRAA